MKQPNNPPAFPSMPYYAPEHKQEMINEGMTLRDYFAAEAMQAILPNDAVEIYYGKVARLAYETADAMLVEREINLSK